jgi:hypothetical protein
VHLPKGIGYYSINAAGMATAFNVAAVYRVSYHWAIAELSFDKPGNGDRLSISEIGGLSCIRGQLVTPRSNV